MTMYMQTYTGKAFFPENPQLDQICIEDIGWALSHQCRYGGHCLKGYYVGEHSIHVSYVVPREYALIGLLHDGHEAYVIDLPRPVKLLLPQYADLEEKIRRMVCDKFGLPQVWPKCVYEADNAVLLAEQKVIMGPAPIPWSIPGTAADVEIHCWHPLVVFKKFMERFEELTRELA